MALGVEVVPDDARERWDSFVSDQETGNLLQSWGWGELRRRLGWEVLRLAVPADGGQGWKGVVQVMRQRLGRAGLSWGYAPQGPVLASLEDVPTARSLLQGAGAWLRQSRALQLKCDPEWPVDSGSANRLRRELGLRSAHFDIQHRQTWLVDLSGGADATQARIPATTRYSVRVSQREGVEVSSAQGDEAVSKFYDLHLDTVGRKGLHTRPLSYYQAAASELGATIFIASQKERPLAGGFTIAFGRRLVHLFGGTSPAVPRARASYALQWAMMQWGVEKGCSVYDMWGIPRRFDPSNGAHGYGTFKTQWGGRLASHQGLLIAPLWGPLDRGIHGIEALALRRRPLLR
ncbi:MAG: lipid II:glycine glycyltransferase FemX [Candidatus Dormibacteria bacterium]